MTNIPCALVTVYLIVLFLRAVFSWFPPPSGGSATLYRMLMDVTEPVLAPLRRVIPAIGMFDLSFTVLFLFLFILRNVVCP